MKNRTEAKVEDYKLLVRMNSKAKQQLQILGLHNSYFSKRSQKNITMSMNDVALLAINKLFEDTQLQIVEDIKEARQA